MPPPRWDIIVSVLLTRRPIIAPPMTAIEQNFQRLSLKREDDKSLLCDFELKSRKDEILETRRAALLEEGKDLSELEGELEETNAMRMDDWNKREEIIKQRLSLHSPIDSSLSSLTRQLDRRLALVVQQNFGRKDYSSPWILPQIMHIKGESLKQTAQRCISTLIPDLSSISLPNAPFGIHTQRYSKGLREQLNTDATGAKMFFYASDISSKTTSINLNEKEINGHSWLTREEIFTTVSGSNYKKTVSRAMIE